jgi:hypothetical protein
MPRRQPGASLFGRAVEAHRRQREDERGDDVYSSDADSDQRRDTGRHSKSDNGRYRDNNPEESGEYSDSEDSDAGTIYSTRESANRTPDQLKKEELIKKMGLLQELTQMERDGVTLSRVYTENDPIEIMSMEIEKHKQTQNENTMVNIYKVCLNVGCQGLQMVNTIKGPWLPMAGWAEAVTADMSIYDRPLRRIHRMYFSRGPAGNPWIELGFCIIGSLIFHILVAKFMSNKQGAAMFMKVFQGQSGGDAPGGGGGIMGALRALTGGMGGMGGKVGPAAGVPTGVPNAGNPFPNHNVPPPQAPRRAQAPPQQHQAPYVPPPQQHQAPYVPPPQQTRAASPTRPQRRTMRRRPGFTRPYHPPSTASPPSMPRPVLPSRQSTSPQQPPVRPAVPPPSYSDEMDSEATMDLNTTHESE